MILSLVKFDFKINI